MTGLSSDIRARDAITGWIAANRVLGLATTRRVRDRTEPWACNLFYAFDPASMALFFMTEPTTRHGADMLADGHVAGAISTQETNVARLRGLQLTGIARPAAGPALETARRLYLGRFPIAALRPGPLWVLSIDTAKFTDNSFGFGTKFRWERTVATPILQLRPSGPSEEK